VPDLKRRVVVLTEIMAPYRIPVLNALAQDTDVDPYVIFLSETDPSLRKWKIYKDEIRFDHAVLPSWRRRVGRYNVLLNRGLRAVLDRVRPDAIVCGGYNYFAAWNASVWARSTRVPLLLWSESTICDQRKRRGIVEFLKREFVRRCDAFVVPGKSAREYLLTLGAGEEDIITAPNAVDNQFFSDRAQAGPSQSDPQRGFELPERYFLYVGRLVTEKGIFELFDAYERLSSAIKSRVGLVFVGDGGQRQELMRRIRQMPSGRVQCVGFLQRDGLASVYSKAEALILPTHSDTWGLVVNEAMACGVPVITTTVAGCAADLVDDSVNGFLVRPGDVAGLSSAMSSLVCDPYGRQKMASCARERIQAYSPEACAVGIAQAVKSLWAECA
jgi:glycosyltransferase involved in cell wall biosynthesis